MKRAISMIMVLVLALSMCVVGASAVESDAISETSATVGTLAFSLSSTITFLRASGPGDTLFAEARERYIGRSTGCYQVDVTNQNGDLIATFESSVFRKDQKVPFEVQE